MTDHPEEPGDEYTGTTFEEDLAELAREIEERRVQDSQGRISHLAEDAPAGAGGADESRTRSESQAGS